MAVDCISAAVQHEDLRNICIPEESILSVAGMVDLLIARRSSVTGC